MQLMNFRTRSLWWTGSTVTVRRGTAPLRGICWLLLLLRGLGPLGAVLRAPLLAVLHARGVQRAADDVIAHARQVLYAAAAHEHDGVLLEVVADAGDVRGDFRRVGQAHARHLAQRRVGLLGRLRVHADAYAALGRAAVQRRRLGLRLDLLPPVTH